jgi:hypothetical protein
MLYSIVLCHALRQRRAAMLALFESLALRFRCRSLLFCTAPRYSNARSAFAASSRLVSALCFDDLRVPPPPKPAPTPTPTPTPTPAPDTAASFFQ